MDETPIKRVMPSSLEAEQSVIGSMIMDKNAILTAAELLTKEDFYYSQYGILFEAITSLYNAGQAVDMVTLHNRLLEMSVPPEISSMEYIGDLLAGLPTSAHVRDYARIVAQKSLLRRLIRANDGITERCYQDSDSVEDILEDTEKTIFSLLQSRTGSDVVPIRQIVVSALERIEKASQSTGNVTGIATGCADLDYKLSGLQPSDLVLVAARPSMGKTAFVLNIAEHIAFRDKKAVALFSLEMSKEQLVNRLFAMESRVDAQNIRSGNLSDNDWENLIESAGVIGNSNLIIDDTPGISLSELRSKCRKFKLEHDIQLVIIDYLQLMSGSSRHYNYRFGNSSCINR